MNVLVTGAGGQLGKEIRRMSANSRHKFFFTDILSDENTHKLDITNPSEVRSFFEEHKIDVIINCAAYTNVDKAEEEAELANRLNNRAVAYLASAARDNGAVLIHISTDYVFKGDSSIAYVETDTANPLCVYGSTKLMGERSICVSGCKYIIFRTSWLYSPHGRNFVKTMIRLTAEKDNLDVVCDQIGTPTFARDLAALIVKIIDENQLDKTGIYNFSDEGVCSWYDFASEICALSGNFCDIRPCTSDEYPQKAARPHFSVLDKRKVKSTFGVVIPYWRDSLVKCMMELKP